MIEENKLEMPPEMMDGFLHIGTCPVAATINIIGGKWKVIILYLISYDIKRFGEMHKLIDGISKKTLTEQLRELEADGIINRKVFAEVPPHVEYSLSEKGFALRPIIFAMRDWGLKHASSAKLV